MDIVESIDSLFENLYQNILKSNGDIKIIQQYLKDTQYNILCYTTVVNNNALERIKPRVLNKECTLV